jgi:outer membrane protein insertion porin family
MAVRACLAALIVLGAAAGSAFAQQPPAGAEYVDRPIHAVTLSIEGRASTDATLMDALVTRPGMPLKMIDVRESIVHLYSLARFEDVRVEAAPADAGVDLHYLLTPVHPVAKVEFHGSLGLSESALRARMVDRVGATPPVSRSGDVVNALLDLYHENGYLTATVTPAPPIVEHVHETATLVFDVNAGPQAMIAHSSVTGTLDQTAAQVANRLGLTSGQPYRPAELQRRAADLVDSLKHRGFYTAASRTTATPDGAGTQVDVAVEIAAGPHVTVQFTGDPIPSDKMADLVPIEREGSVDPDILDESADRITNYFRQQGYWKASVDPPEEKQSGSELVIVFHVTRGALYRVAPAGVEISGNQAVTTAELKPLVRIVPGEPYVASRLDATVAAMKQLYLTKGFASVDQQAAANETGPGLVTPVITIKEGPRVVVGTVAVSGNHGLTAADLLRGVQTKTGMPYYQPTILADRDRLQVDYLNAGDASAQVIVPAPTLVPTSAGARADIVFKVVEGTQTIVDHIFVTGNVRTSTDVIERELKLHPGQPLGLADQIESRRRLSALGLFRRVEISTVSYGDPSHRDVIVAIEEALQTTIAYGGGLEVDRRLALTSASTSKEQYEFAPRGFFEIGRRNLGGKNRSVDLYTRLSLRPNDTSTSPNLFGFSEYRVVGTYREPQALNNFGDLTATAAVEQGVRTSFNFARKGLNAQLTHAFSSRIGGSARYAFDTTRIFDLNQTIPLNQQLTVDRVFPQVRLSTFSFALSRDSRDDLVDPQHGSLLTADSTIAGRAMGSQVGFTKTFLQAFLYRNLGKPNLVFAGGARVGLASAFPQIVILPDPNTGVPTPQKVRDLPAAERFFAGGDTTIRGYALDSVGTPSTISAEGFPKGGGADIILNAELRAPIHGRFGAVAFVDGGNVFPRPSDLQLSQLLGSVGFGARYRSPVGPIRMDIGFKLKRRVIGGQLEGAYAFHFSIGQAF